MEYVKPNRFYYRIAQLASWNFATFVFKRKTLRNEIKNKKGSFVVIANHQAAYDFVNLIGATHRPMSFVISQSFYNSLPIKGFMNKMGVIPKQQFQTAVRDLKRIKAVIDRGEPVVIYPAGLMCEDGLSTPIPAATYKFLKWLETDVYVARASGTYFVMPKWTKGLRPGRTYMDIYKLFDKEDLASMELDEVQRRTDEAILFDAYREQEEHQVKYKNNAVIDGLENVLYQCPHCHTEFAMQVREHNTITCTACGYEQVSDDYALMHNRRGLGEEVRYVSDWSRLIYERLKSRIRKGLELSLEDHAIIHMIDPKADKFTEVGQAHVHLSKDGFRLCGEICGEAVDLTVSVANIPTLPFKPGKYFEIQHGADIYRCYPEDGRLTMKFINMVKIFYELRAEKKAMQTV